MDSFLQRLRPIWNAHPGQEEFLRSTAKTKILACGRRWGKTDACAAQVLSALLGTRPTKHLLIGPTLDQARLLFQRVLALLQDFIERYAVEMSGSLSKVRMSPYPQFGFGSHSVTARSGHVGRSLRGNEATHVVVDEAAFVPEELITEVVSPMLATNDGDLTLISTPNGMNHFWRYFEMGRQGRHGFWSRKAPSSESPHVSQRFLQVQKELISERAYSVEYEAAFRDGAGRIFRTEAIEACLVTQLPESRGSICIGVDWAKYGDYSAVAVLQGTRERAVLLEIHRIARSEWPVQVRQVAQIIARYGSPFVYCDQTGMGDPLLDLLRKETPAGVEGITFSTAVKAGLVDNLARLVECAALVMRPHPQLIEEMQHFESRRTASGHERLEARGSYHDDLVVALALAAHGLPTSDQPRISLGDPRHFATDIRS